MNKSVILHVASIDGNPYAGAEVAVLNHIKYQSKYSKLLLLNCGNYKLETPNESYKTINYKEIDMIKNLENPFNKPNLIVFHSIYYPKYLRLANQARKLNIPYIIIPHGGLQVYAQKSKRLKKIIGNYLFFNRFLKNATAIQYLCTEEKINSDKKNNNYIISGNGFEVTNTHKKYGEVMNKKDFEFIYIGRYDIHFKGLDLLIESIFSIQDFIRNNNIRISLYGKKNSDYDSLKLTVQEYGIDDLVFLNNEIYGEEKQKVLLDADVFIQTSRSEGQPLGVIEAISLGLPCVLTVGTNFGEIVKKERIGWVANFSKEDVTNAIKTAYLEKKMLPKMSKRAYDYAKQNLSWDKVSINTLECYEKVIRQYGKAVN